MIGQPLSPAVPTGDQGTLALIAAGFAEISGLIYLVIASGLAPGDVRCRRRLPGRRGSDPQPQMAFDRARSGPQSAGDRRLPLGIADRECRNRATEYRQQVVPGGASNGSRHVDPPLA